MVFVSGNQHKQTENVVTLTKPKNPGLYRNTGMFHMEVSANVNPKESGFYYKNPQNGPPI